MRNRFEHGGPRGLARLAAIIVVLGACIVLAPSAAGAASTSGCNPLVALLGGCSVTVTSTSTPSHSPACSGETPPAIPNHATWACTFDDEFAGTALNRSTWTVQTTATYGFHSGAECMVDDPHNVAVTGGHLNLTVRDTGAPFTCTSPSGDYQTQYTGASVYTISFGQEYGRFEIRARFADSSNRAGVQGSLWLYPRKASAGGILGGPTEIDIAEAYSRHDDMVAPTVHSMANPLNSTYCMVPAYGSAFHTYTAIWTASSVTFQYDGVTCYKASVPLTLPAGLRGPNPFLVALTEALGVGNNANDAQTPLPATLQVDYVRVWK
jgi:beta-glucanase (GH16 family)